MKLKSSILLFCTLSLLLTGCYEGKVDAINEPNEIIKTIALDQQVNVKPVEKPLTLDAEFLESVKKGYIPGIEFGLTTNLVNIKSKWGEPQERRVLGFEPNDKAYRWKNYQYHYLKLDNQNERAYRMEISGNALPYSLTDVINMLGKPNTDKLDTDGNHYIVYLIGYNTLSFHAETKTSSIKYASLNINLPEKDFEKYQKEKL
ncbi:MAG: hypothetical protein K0R55_2297 [Sporomusa sp.]|nr:hypothetical protein [Sporomusa sp.]